MVLMQVAESTRRSDIASGGGSVDGLGRSLQDLVGFLNHLQVQETKAELFLHQQGLDTTTSSGRAMFGMLSVKKRTRPKIKPSDSRMGRPRMSLSLQCTLSNARS